MIWFSRFPCTSPTIRHSHSGLSFVWRFFHFWVFALISTLSKDTSPVGNRPLIWGWRQDPLSVLHSTEDPKLLLKPDKCGSLSGDITWLSLLLGTYQASLKDSLCLLWRPRITEVTRAAETREPLKQNEEGFAVFRKRNLFPQKLSESQTLDPFTQIADSATTHRPEPSRSASIQRL